ERGRERRSEAVEEWHAGRGLLVAHVRIGDLRERRQDLRRAPGRPAERDERLAGARLEAPVAVAVDQRDEARVARMPTSGRVVRRATAAADRRKGERDQQGRASHAASFSAGAIGSRRTRRATQAAASSASALRPAATSATWSTPAVSGRSA